MTTAIRFVSMTNSTAGPLECWPWTGAVNEHGYGMIHNNGGRRRATHIALELDGRPRPEGREACHECDNPICVNPAHLFWGTHAENLAGMRARHRSNAGERNGGAKLTAAKAVAMRRDRANGDSYATICARYDVGKSTVSRIIRRTSWVDAEAILREVTS